MRGQTGKFRCDECHRVKRMEDGGPDCGASHWFCWDCLVKIEEGAMLDALSPKEKADLAS